MVTKNTIMSVKAYKTGTNVCFDRGTLQGVITAILIRDESVRYEVSYFLNGEFKEIWLNETMFVAEGNKTTIGYRNMQI